LFNEFAKSDSAGDFSKITKFVYLDSLISFHTARPCPATGQICPHSGTALTVLKMDEKYVTWSGSCFSMRRMKMRLHKPGLTGLNVALAALGLTDGLILEMVRLAKLLLPARLVLHPVPAICPAARRAMAGSTQISLIRR
jgi:hypothetical protein